MGGGSSTAVFRQSGGSHTVGRTLVLAAGPGSVGNYHLSGGLLATAGTRVGSNGLGSFIQTGGDHIVANNVRIADYLVFDPVQGQYRRSGYYALSAGRLSTSQLVVGAVGIGEFVQSDGVVAVAGSLNVGSAQNSSGTYRLSGGTVSTERTYVGSVSTGLFVHSGGSQAVADSLWVSSIPGQASYLLSGNGALTANRVVVGHVGAGLFQQSGGTVALGDNLTVGNSAGGSGEYFLSDGALTAVNTFVGVNAHSVGLLSQTGGTHTLTQRLTIAGTLLGAASAQAHGTYELAGGTLTAASVLNYDHFNFSGGALQAPVTNHGSFTLSGPGTRTIDMLVDNFGLIKVSDTIVDWQVSPNLEAGVYASDPSLNRFTDLRVGGTAVLLAAAGDRFVVSNDLVVTSSASSSWDTAGASLEFVPGADGAHLLTLPAWRLNWGTLSLSEGQTLELAGGMNLGLQSLVIAPGATLRLNGANVFYAALDNRGSIDQSNGGQLLPSPVPEPATYLMLSLGLALVSAHARRGARLGHRRSASAGRWHAAQRQQRAQGLPSLSSLRLHPEVLHDKNRGRLP